MIDLVVQQLRLWFVALDTLRLQRSLVGDLRQATAEMVPIAACHADVCVVDFALIASGARIIVQARSREPIRKFVRRLTALLAARPASTGLRWRPVARVCEFRRRQLDAYQAYIDRCRSVTYGDQIMPRKTKSAKGRFRSEIALLKIIERSNESLFGGEEYAARIRRYIASHDAPQDDRTAFGRLCSALFAQGLGFEVVERHRAALESAFHQFNPSAVAAIGDERVEELMREPIIRNKPKIIACVENAKRWSQLASSDGSYLARVAKIAAEDNPGAGWPKLIETLRGDFRRLGEPTARMTLKRWGFFTAAVHPGSQRLLQRLNLLKDETDDMGVQRFVVSVAQVTGTDPYAIEAALAIFAANGPCKPKPVCTECRLQTECPSAKMALAAS